MPFVRVSLPAGRSGQELQTIAHEIYEAMREAITIPEDDRFIVFSQHAEGTMFLDPTYMGIDRTAEVMVIEITLRNGRTDTMKQALYASIAERLHRQAGIRKQDVMIVLRENGLADWSFGNGIGQYIGK